MNYAESLYRILACPYDPETPLTPQNGGALHCTSCGRTYQPRDGFIDLRPDDLRSGTGTWQPGEPGWDPGVLSIFGGQTPYANELGSTDKADVLDIGCGARGIGTVNIDVYVPAQVPPNFILAAADMLPFLPKTFDRVVSRYVIEHVTEPAKFIESCLRLARKEVEIVTDNGDWLGEVIFRLVRRGRIYHPEHVYKWSVEYLENLCKRFDVSAEVRLETLSDTPIVKLIGALGKGPVLAPLLHRDLRARLIQPA